MSTLDKEIVRNAFVDALGRRLDVVDHVIDAYAERYIRDGLGLDEVMNAIEWEFFQIWDEPLEVWVKAYDKIRLSD